jgi:hypothetical protein
VRVGEALQAEQMISHCRVTEAQSTRLRAQAARTRQRSVVEVEALQRAQRGCRRGHVAEDNPRLAAQFLRFKTDHVQHAAKGGEAEVQRALQLCSGSSVAASLARREEDAPCFFVFPFRFETKSVQLGTFIERRCLAAVTCEASRRSV